eukprot:10745491-Karenia_brevis.AAC.1
MNLEAGLSGTGEPLSLFKYCSGCRPIVNFATCSVGIVYKSCSPLNASRCRKGPCQQNDSETRSSSM